MHSTLEKAELDPAIYRFGEFELDLKTETLRGCGEELNINHRMFQVLRLLVERHGEVVSKQEFFEKVWGGTFVEDNNLTVVITALRKALGDNAKQARFIENLPRKGYRFVAPVTNGAKAAAFNGNGHNGAGHVIPDGIATAKADITVPEKPPEAGSRRLIFAALSAGLLVVLVAAAVGFSGFLSPVSSNANRIESVAVLPFENKTEGDEYLSDGLTDGIIGNLSRLSGLRVIDRNSAYKYKDNVSDPMAVGRELNVRAVVTGQVEQNGDVLIINAELTDTSDGTRLWQQQMRRRTADMFAVQQEISQAITQNLHFVPNEKASKRQTDDPIAYDLYLKGRYYWNKRTSPDHHKAAEFFQAAIDRDPTFAKAYVGLANTYTLGGFANAGTTEEKNARIRQYIQKALEIDDTLGEAYAASGINKCYYDWDFAGCESDFKRAVELSPNDATAHHWYADHLSMQGRFDESFAEYEKAMSLDPLSIPIRLDFAFAHYYARDHDKAIEILNKVKETAPDYYRTYNFLLFVYREKGMYVEAADAEDQLHTVYSQKVGRSRKEFELYKKMTADLKNAAKENGADGYWQTVLKNRIHFEDDPIYAAVAHAKAGHADTAFEYLEKALKERYSGLVWLKVTPELDNLRSDPRYQDLLQRVGF